ncbi:MAG TPA: hypothetical protein VFA09_23235 [Ktedonobacteraceae bacterium]|nr:hypothetical protein [Ktedonobacteraceae bacterium]
MIRLLILLLTRRWGLIVCGVILVIAGLIWGAVGSHQVTYETSQPNTNYHIGSGSETGNIYINADGSSDYFVALNGSFGRSVAQSDIDNSTAISFVARTDTTSVDLNVNGTTVNEAHQIEKLVFYDSSGNVLGTYTTSEYLANPNGFYDNEWLKSIWLIIAGAILGVLGLVLPMFRKRPQVASPVFTGAVGAQPAQPYSPYQAPTVYGQPYQGPQAAPDPYGQAYQGPQQYPQQYPQATQYPSQQPGNQPGYNPYQQPPQG